MIRDMIYVTLLIAPIRDTKKANIGKKSPSPNMRFTEDRTRMFHVL